MCGAVISIALGFRSELFRFRADAGGTGFHPFAVLQDGLQVDMLFHLGSDVGVAAREAVKRSASANRACSGHSGE